MQTSCVGLGNKGLLGRGQEISAGKSEVWGLSLSLPPASFMSPVASAKVRELMSTSMSGVGIQR